MTVPLTYMQTQELKYLAKHEPLWSRVTPTRAQSEQSDSDLWLYIRSGLIHWADDRGYRITDSGRAAVGLDSEV